MEHVLVNLVALLRPLASIERAAPVFEIAGVGLFALLSGAFLAKLAVSKALRLSIVDAFILAFVGWCLAASIVYYDAARPAEVAKLTLPLLGYTIVKNVFVGTADYRTFLLWAMAGFAIPLVASAILIAAGSALAIDMVNYWTGVTRWEGVYAHSHVLAHSATLSMMALALYLGLAPGTETGEKLGRLKLPEAAFLALLGSAALFCLYMSQVRTAIIGLMVFVAVYFYFRNRKALLVGAAAATVLAIGTVSYWYSALLPELVTSEQGVEVELSDIGSGRPSFWLNDLAIFSRQPLERQIAGVGIGARGEHSVTREAIRGHSDWLELLTQTGVVGFLLFAGLQLAVFVKILRLQSSARHLFVALFLAVNFMMLVSNSYAWRIQVSQIFYMMLALVEVPAFVGAGRRGDRLAERAGLEWRQGGHGVARSGPGSA